MLLTPPPKPPGDSPPCPVPMPLLAAPRSRDEHGRLLPGHTLGGRPPGSLNRATVILQSLFEGGAAELGAAVLVNAIKRSDTGAARLVLDRLYPVRKGNPVEIPDFPAVQRAADVPRALAALLDAVTAGVLTADEAKPIADLLGTFVSALDATTLDERLTALEALQPGSKTRGY